MKKINGTKSSKQIISNFTLILYYRIMISLCMMLLPKKIAHKYSFRKSFESARLLSNGPKLTNFHIDLHFIDLNLYNGHLPQDIGE